MTRKTITLPPEEPADGQEPDSFVVARTSFELFGQPLKKYSISRKLAADAMGIIYGRLPPDSEERLKTTGTYPGLLRDVVCVLWLCSISAASEQTEEEARKGSWTPARALLRPGEAMDAAMAWAEPLGLADDAEKLGEAAQVFAAIMNNVSAAEFRLVTSDKGAPDELGKV